MRPFDQYKRFFAFGCSFTKYHWPTWADIIGHVTPEYYNYAQSGGGNLFISNSIVEANLKHNFTTNDLIMVMWTSICREDRYKNGLWSTPGNIYAENVFEPKEFVENWADNRFYLMRDLAIIEQSHAYLKSLPCDFDMLKMIEFEDTSGGRNSPEYNESNPDVLNLYHTTTEKVKPSIHELIYNGEWEPLEISGWGNVGQTADYHPTTLNYLKYLESFYTCNDKMTGFARYYNKALLKCSSLDDTIGFWNPPMPTRL